MKRVIPCTGITPPPPKRGSGVASDHSGVPPSTPTLIVPGEALRNSVTTNIWNRNFPQSDPTTCLDVPSPHADDLPSDDRDLAALSADGAAKPHSHPTNCLQHKKLPEVQIFSPLFFFFLPGAQACSAIRCLGNHLASYVSPAHPVQESSVDEGKTTKMVGPSRDSMNCQSIHIFSLFSSNVTCIKLFGHKGQRERERAAEDCRATWRGSQRPTHLPGNNLLLS